MNGQDTANSDCTPDSVQIKGNQGTVQHVATRLIGVPERAALAVEDMVETAAGLHQTAGVGEVSRFTPRLHCTTLSLWGWTRQARHAWPDMGTESLLHFVSTAVSQFS